MAKSGGYITRDDLTRYRTIEREALRGTYRGFDIVGPPPPSSGPLHIIQMLNILEGYDIGALGFGSRGHAASAGRGAEDRLRRSRGGHRRSGLRQGAGGEAAVEGLCAPTAARASSLARAQSWSAEVAPGEGAHTTHLTVADGMGNIVASTQTINSLFGARYIVPGTGHDPEQLHVRVYAASRPRQFGGARQAHHLVDVAGDRAEDGKPRYALGLPGGLRIFPSVMQAICRT